MRNLILILLFISAKSFASGVESAEKISRKKVELTSAQLKQISKEVELATKNYYLALDKNSFDQFKSTVTAEFIMNMGGEAAAKENFNSTDGAENKKTSATKQSSDSEITKVEIKPHNTMMIFAKVSFKNKSKLENENNPWLELIKEKSGWKVNKLHAD
jgi:hypothetical protein